jgi:hypothetical protein
MYNKSSRAGGSLDRPSSPALLSYNSLSQASAPDLGRQHPLGGPAAAAAQGQWGLDGAFGAGFGTGGGGGLLGGSPAAGGMVQRSANSAIVGSSAKLCHRCARSLRPQASVLWPAKMSAQNHLTEGFCAMHLRWARQPPSCARNQPFLCTALHTDSCRAMRRSESMHRRMVDLVAAAKMRTQTNSKRQELVGLR